MMIQFTNATKLRNAGQRPESQSPPESPKGARPLVRESNAVSQREREDIALADAATQREKRRTHMNTLRDRRLGTATPSLASPKVPENAAEPERGFKKGDCVKLSSRSLDGLPRASRFEILGRLPDTASSRGGPRQYRVIDLASGHERVLAETNLTSS